MTLLIKAQVILWYFEDKGWFIWSFIWVNEMYGINVKELSYNSITQNLNLAFA